MFLFDLAFGHVVIGTQSGIPDLLGDDWECGEDVLEFLTGDTVKMGHKPVQLCAELCALRRIGDSVFVRAKPNLAGKLVKLGSGADELGRTADKGQELRVIFG